MRRCARQAAGRSPLAAQGDPLDHAVLVAEVADDRMLRDAIVPEAEVVSGIAAPVLGTDGVAHAAVGVQGPSLRLTPARLRELAPLVRHAAEEIGARVHQP